MKRFNFFYRIILVIILLAHNCINWKSNYSLNKDKVLYALNCGSEKQFTSKDGFVYQPDKWYKEGVVATYFNHKKVPRTGFKYTRDQNLHRTERYSTRGFLEYDLPLEQDGDYVLILQFAEVNFERLNQRVVNILLGDTIVRPSHDTLKAGKISSLNIYIPFSLRNRKVKYANKFDCENAMDEDSNLRLRFEPLIDNPKIDGIVMFKGTLKETNFYSQDEMREYYDKAYTGRKNTELLRDQMMEEYMLKKRMKRKVRNDFEEHDEFENHIITTPKDGGISKKTFLLGILALVAAFCTFNRRKGGKNPILLVKDSDYYDSLTSKKKRN